MQQHQRQQTTTTVAVLGANTLLDRILARLLEDEGYDAKLLDSYPTNHINELLDGVDVLLLSSHLDDNTRETFLNTIRSNPEEAAQRVPVLSLCVVLQVALLDKLAVNVFLAEPL